MPNVVLVVMDTARRDRFGCYGYAQPTTPNVDALAESGFVATRMFTTAPYTLPSHASLFTGLYPSQHGAQWRSSPALGPQVQLTMAEWFASLGYDTVCATNNGLISSATRLDRGFDRYAYRLELETRTSSAVRRAKRTLAGNDSGGGLTNRWLARELKTVTRPLFLFVNFLECHWAYVPPMREVRRLGRPRQGPLEGLMYRASRSQRLGPWEAIATATERDLDIYSALYDAEVGTADRLVGELLSILGVTGHLDDTIVLITSDHGEHIGEDGLADHQASLSDHLIHVPFVAWGPGMIEPGRRSDPYEFVDVWPSLARFLGRDLPVDYLAERRTSLFLDGTDPDESPYTFAEWRSWGSSDLERLSRRNPSYDFTGLDRDLVSIRDGGRELLRRSDGTESWEPGPPQMPDDSSKHRARLAAALDDKTSSWRAWETTASPLTVEDEAAIEEQLTALGYI